eukprot:7075221-Prorocentrum_lima.AAC.1
MTSSLVGSEMCIRDRVDEGLLLESLANDLVEGRREAVVEDKLNLLRRSFHAMLGGLLHGLIVGVPRPATDLDR